MTNELRFWLMKGETPAGPFDVAQIHAQLTSGEVTWQTMACPVGDSSWLPLLKMPLIGPTASAIPDPPPALLATAITADVPAEMLPRASVPIPGPSQRMPTQPLSFVVQEEAGRSNRPWNPVVIAWLALPFTPMWAGVMAALNGKRLGTAVSPWLPLLIGFGYLVLDIWLSWLVDSYLLSVALYLGSIGLLWFLILQEQHESFKRSQSISPGSSANWVWPSVSGIPLAFMALFAFVIEPLRPLEPREVCERFVAANSSKEGEKYVTLNLVPALRALDKLPQNDDPFDFELTEENLAPADVGGYFVGCRGSFVEAGQHTQIEGFFHLVQRNGEWKIEDIYFTAMNRQPLERWVSMAQDYQMMLNPSAPQTVPGGAPPARPGLAPSSPSKGSAKSSGPYISNRSKAYFAFLLGAAVLTGLGKLLRKKGKAQ